MLPNQLRAVKSRVCPSCGTDAVDTHVFRVSARIGLTTGAKTPLETERQLVANLSEEEIPIAHHWLILHGRYVCTARNPHCAECGVREACRHYNNRQKQK